MGNFFRGLVLVMLGFLVGLAAGIMSALEVWDKPDPTLADSPIFGTIMLLGFTVMILGPVLFWVVAPLVSLFRRHRKEPV